MKIRDLLIEIRGCAEYEKFLAWLKFSNTSRRNLSQEDIKKFVDLTIKIARKTSMACRVFVGHALPHSMPKDKSEKSLAGAHRKAEELGKTIEFTINQVLPEFAPFLKAIEEKLAPKESELKAAR